MNPMVFTILAWEREMEIQRQAHVLQHFNPDEPLPRNRQLRRSEYRPIFARLLGLRPQSPCQCS